MRKLSELTVLIKGGGEVASGVAHKLHRSHLRVCLTEIARPLAVSRGTAFSEAIYDGTKTIMGVTARLVPASVDEIHRVWEQGNIAIVIDPETSIRQKMKPDIFIDATMAKRNRSTKITDAPLVIGMGPGFYAGKDVHVVIETNNSPNLGKVILEGAAEPNTGLPVNVGGLTRERVVWAPHAGVFTSDRKIGDSVAAGERIAWIGDQPLVAPLSGMLRGLLRSGANVSEGAKLIEVDPVNDRAICNFIADKMRFIADGVLEAIELKLGADA